LTRANSRPLKTVLIVEDECIISILIEKFVQKLGYSVVGKVENGEDAVDAALRLHPDIILMDIQLSGRMDGIEATRKIKEKTGVSVIFVTGNSDNGTRERAMETNPDAYLIKPVDMITLKKHLELSAQTG
jgi:two-component system, response regulator PdtaR